jgi:type I restriction-modification system DNA methylase subunit
MNTDLCGSICVYLCSSVVQNMWKDQNMAISTTIKTIQDIMRKDAGVDGDAQRISQLVWMLFLKIFEDREKEYELMEEDYLSPIPEKLRWRNWAADPEGITGDELSNFVNSQTLRRHTQPQQSCGACRAVAL